MVAFERILCAVDFSEPSEHALLFSSLLAKQLNKKLHLLNVLAPVPIYPTEAEIMLGISPQAIPSELHRANYLKDRLELTRKHYEEKGFDVTAETLSGEPSKALLEYTSNCPNDLLIMGTHGYRGIPKFLLGSTAMDVLRRSSVPVLTIREQHKENPIQKIIVGVDFSAACEPAIEYGVSLSRATGANLEFVYVMSPLEIAGSPETTVPVYRKEIIDANKAVAMKEFNDIREKIDDIDAECTILTGASPYRELVQYISECKADLLIVGTHGRTGIKRFFLGSVMERLVQVSPCPVLSIRQPHEVPFEFSWKDVAGDSKF